MIKDVIRRELHRARGHLDSNAILVPKENADRAMDAAACIGCGACVAMCPNASASLFMDLALGFASPGAARALRPRLSMVARAAEEGFGGCTDIGECEAVCPKEIRLEVIARMNGDFLRAAIDRARVSGGGSGEAPA